MNSSEFVDTLISRVPEARRIVQEHRNDYDGDLPLHLVIADLRGLAVSWFDDGTGDPLERLLAVLEAGLAEGDDYVENAVAVSFVEDAAWWEPSRQAFIATWPRGLVAEVERQKSAQT